MLSYLDEYEFLLAPIIFTLLSFATRMYRIGRSNIVTWDEAQYVVPTPSLLSWVRRLTTAIALASSAPIT